MALFRGRALLTFNPPCRERRRHQLVSGRVWEEDERATSHPGLGVAGEEFGSQHGVREFCPAPGLSVSQAGRQSGRSVIWSSSGRVGRSLGSGVLQGPPVSAERVVPSVMATLCASAEKTRPECQHAAQWRKLPDSCADEGYIVEMPISGLPLNLRPLDSLMNIFA